MGGADRRTAAGGAPATPGSADADRLDSWKEIAAQLRREVRTVQRWEKSEGLPVHRHLHQRLGSVYAYRSELDAWWKARRSDLERAPRQRRTMIAVLPIENWSREPEHEYLSDGITEEMIVELGRLNPERLGVIARQSAMAYKGTKKRADEIGRELGVDYLVGGSARRGNRRLRVTAHLIQVKDQSELWAETYDRDLGDLLALQHEVAATIAQKIRVALAPHVAPRGRRETNAEAYEAYLYGRFWLNKRTPEAFGRAFSSFERAAAFDPRSALPHTGLADYYNLLAYYGAAPPMSVYPKAREAAQKAIELEETLPEAHALLAEVSYLYDWDWENAEREFGRAVELGPNCVIAHQWYGVFLSLLARRDEASRELRAAERLDPLSVLVGTQIGLALYEARQYEAAIERLRRTLELDASFPLAHTCLGMACLQRSLYDEAIAALERARQLAPADLTPLALLGYAHALAGRRSEARKFLRSLKALSKERPVSAAYACAVHIGLGELEAALDLAEQACEERSGFLTRLKVEPLLDPLRSEPRFAKLLRTVGLAEPVRSRALADTPA
ncbi:MAG: tetratricopeptide repeat protein [Deltaproteobacteria bacterium]|nr:tetratricopeptide repeat protein [Deltaproteobacteria bacterium]